MKNLAFLMAPGRRLVGIGRTLCFNAGHKWRDGNRILAMKANNTAV
jgi:hypothetical protein